MAIEQIGGFSAVPTSSHTAPSTHAVAPAPPSQATLITGTKAPQATTSIDQVRDAIKKIEQVIAPTAQDLRFSIDDDTGKTVVKVIDTETQTVLRQIPTKEVLEISKALDKLQGLLVRQKA